MGEIKMTHAEKCPICLGNGILRYIDGIEISGIKLNGEAEKICHGCNGKGWIQVGIDYPQDNCPEVQIKANSFGAS